jgi:hypothetical protein
MAYKFPNLMETPISSIFNILRCYYNLEMPIAALDVAKKTGVSYIPAAEKIKILLVLGYLERIKIFNGRKLRSNGNYCIITQKGVKLYDVLAQLSTEYEQHRRDTALSKRKSEDSTKTQLFR